LRHEKAEVLLRIAFDMQGTAEGLSLEDIQRNYADKPLSRRTAERLRDAIERIFPQMEQANPREIPKRWRIPAGTTARLVSVTAEELAALKTAVSLLRRENLLPQAENAERAVSKLRAILKPDALKRIETDLEALTEAEGIAMRTGPRPVINPDVVATLREAILANRRLRLWYSYRGSGKTGYETVHPYGFIYGSRHYLVAWSESDWAEDFRNYALSNIQKAEILEGFFTRQPYFQLKDYASRSFGVFQEKPFNAVWRFSPKAAGDAREFLFHPSQRLEEQLDGSLIVRFRAGGALEMCWHLLTWGESVEVIAPARLRKLVREYVSRLADATTNPLIWQSSGSKR